MEIPAAWPKETDWTQLLGDYLASHSFYQLQQFVVNQRKHHTVYPDANHVFRAFQITAFAKTRVVILGQDPYHGPGQAHGLAFSVPPGVRTPPSLRNILQELSTDLNITPSDRHCGDLTSWSQQGVLLLNTVLTVRQGMAGSHQNQGWEDFTDHVIERLNEHPSQLVFILWGKSAGRKKTLIHSRHATIESAHPSPLSAYRGFLGSKPFSKTNSLLQSWQSEPIGWQSVFQSHSIEQDRP